MINVFIKQYFPLIHHASLEHLFPCVTRISICVYRTNWVIVATISGTEYRTHWRIEEHIYIFKCNALIGDLEYKLMMNKTGHFWTGCNWFPFFLHLIQILNVLYILLCRSLFLCRILFGVLSLVCTACLMIIFFLTLPPWRYWSLPHHRQLTLKTSTSKSFH